MLTRQERSIILITDDTEDSGSARAYLHNRHIKFAEVTIKEYMRAYEAPSLVTHEVIWVGLEQIKYAIDSAQYL